MGPPLTLSDARLLCVLQTADGVREVACAALCTACCKNADNQRQVGECGGVEILLEVLEEAEGDVLREGARGRLLRMNENE